MNTDLSLFHVTVRKYYAWAVLWKSCLFGSIGLAFASAQDVATSRVILGFVAVLFLVTATEYFWLYRPSMKRHFELVERFGLDYERKLTQAIQQIGYKKIVSSYWVARCYDEMARDMRD